MALPVPLLQQTTQLRTILDDAYSMTIHDDSFLEEQPLHKIGRATKRRKIGFEVEHDRAATAATGMTPTPADTHRIKAADHMTALEPLPEMATADLSSETHQGSVEVKPAATQTSPCSTTPTSEQAQFQTASPAEAPEAPEAVSERVSSQHADDPDDPDAEAPVLKKARTASKHKEDLPVRRKSRSKWDNPIEMLTNQRSPLGTAMLRDLLCTDRAWDILTEDEKNQVLKQFPQGADILDPGTEQARPNIVALRNNNNFRHDISRYQEDLREGRHDPEWISQAQAAHRKRELGFYDDFLARKFEEDWGIPMPSPKGEQVYDASLVDSPSSTNSKTSLRKELGMDLQVPGSSNLQVDVERGSDGSNPDEALREGRHGHSGDATSGGKHCNDELRVQSDNFSGPTSPVSVNDLSPTAIKRVHLGAPVPSDDPEAQNSETEVMDTIIVKL